jgi:flagellar biosynthesis component FlhA
MRIRTCSAICSARRACGVISAMASRIRCRSYKDMRALLDRLDPEYKRLLDEICPSQISYSGLQARQVVADHLGEVGEQHRGAVDRLEAAAADLAGIGILLDEICPSQISYSGLQAVLKLLLAERVSIRNLHPRACPCRTGIAAGCCGSPRRGG